MKSIDEFEEMSNKELVKYVVLHWDKSQPITKVLACRLEAMAEENKVLATDFVKENLCPPPQKEK